jgi:hypothetical protein
MAMACSLLKSMRLQGVLCGEAVRHDTYLLNRLPTKSMGDQTPFEAWSGKKPHLAHLRVFGCVAHAKITTPHLRKLKDRRKMLVYFGIEEGSKAHPLFDPHHKKICVSRDVIFQEHIEWNWNDGASHDGPRDFIEETNTVSPVSSLVPIVSASGGAPVPAAVRMAAPSEGLTSSAASTPLDQPAPGSPSAEPATQVDKNILTPQFVGAPDSDDGPVQYRHINSIMRDTRRMELLDVGTDEEAMLPVMEEQSCYRESVSQPAWKDAMVKEIESI